MDKPESLTNLEASLKNYYQSTHLAMDRADKFYRGDFTDLFGKFNYDVPIYRSSTPAMIVDTYRNQLRTDEPRVSFIPPGTSKKAEAKAALMTLWGENILKRERENSELDPNLQCGFSLILRGAACKKILLDTQSIPNKPPRRGSARWDEYEAELMKYWPFISRSIDPMTVYPAPGYRRPLQYILEVQSRRVYDMWESYPDWSDPAAKAFAEKHEMDKANDPTRKVKWLEYWSASTYKDGKMVSPGWYICEADGERVVEKQNIYGFVPYIYEYSGLGMRHADADPKYLAVGLLTGIDGELEQEVYLKTALAAQTLMHVFPTVLTTEDPVQFARKFSVGPGKILQHPPGQEPKYMEPPPPNENFMSLLGEVKQSLVRIAPSSLGGTREPGVDYGVLQSQLTGQGLTTIRHIRSTLDRIGTASLNMMASMMHRFELDMNVQGSGETVERARMIEGKDFENLNFNVRFEIVDPAEDRVQLMAGESIRRAGDISRRTYWKVFAPNVVKDADQEEALLLTEQIIASMSQSGQLAQIVLQEEGIENQLNQQQQMQEQAQKQVQQNRVSEAVPEGATSYASNLEKIAGTPGSTQIPRIVAEEAARSVKKE